MTARVVVVALDRECGLLGPGERHRAPRAGARRLLADDRRRFGRVGGLGLEVQGLVAVSPAQAPRRRNRAGAPGGCGQRLSMKDDRRSSTGVALLISPLALRASTKPLPGRSDCSEKRAAATTPAALYGSNTSTQSRTPTTSPRTGWTLRLSRGVSGCEPLHRVAPSRDALVRGVAPGDRSRHPAHLPPCRRELRRGGHVHAPTWTSKSCCRSGRSGPRRGRRKLPLRRRQPHV